MIKLKPVRPLESTIKKLFSLSRNKCAFPQCSHSLVNSENLLIGAIAHIEAENPNGPRYNPNRSARERVDFDNLIILCPNHHALIDSDNITYTVVVLKKMKNDHEMQLSSALLSLDYRTDNITPDIHEYELEVSIRNNSGTTIKNPKLKVSLPTRVFRVCSFLGKKRIDESVMQIDFPKLDITEIHPGEEELIMPSSNVGINYFMDSAIHNDHNVMNQIVVVKLFGDSMIPIEVIKDFRSLQKF